MGAGKTSVGLELTVSSFMSTTYYVTVFYEYVVDEKKSTEFNCTQYLRSRLILTEHGDWL